MSILPLCDENSKLYICHNVHNYLYFQIKKKQPRKALSRYSRRKIV